MGVGDPSSQRIYDEAMARGIEPRPKGPKPIVGWSEEDDEDSGSGSGGGVGGVGAGVESNDAAVAPRAVSAPAQLPAALPPAPRGTGGGDMRTGPKSPAEAWKWEGVPPGAKFLSPVEPGRQRWCIYDDAVGPKVMQLPAAWPPEDTAAST
jgi:hypothetical protein